MVVVEVYRVDALVQQNWSGLIGSWIGRDDDPGHEVSLLLIVDVRSSLSSWVLGKRSSKSKGRNPITPAADETGLSAAPQIGTTILQESDHWVVRAHADATRWTAEMSAGHHATTVWRSLTICDSNEAERAPWCTSRAARSASSWEAKPPD